MIQLRIRAVQLYCSVLLAAAHGVLDVATPNFVPDPRDQHFANLNTPVPLDTIARAPDHGCLVPALGHLHHAPSP